MAAAGRGGVPVVARSDESSEVEESERADVEVDIVVTVSPIYLSMLLAMLLHKLLPRLPMLPIEPSGLLEKDALLKSRSRSESSVLSACVGA